MDKGRRHFGRDCGSQVFAQDVGDDEIELGLGSFDEPNRFRPPMRGFRHYSGNREDSEPDK